MSCRRFLGWLVLYETGVVILEVLVDALRVLCDIERAEFWVRCKFTGPSREHCIYSGPGVDVYVIFGT